MTSAAVSVSQLTALVRGTLARAPELEDVLVEGEVSNVSRPGSGHLYFTLKDAAAQLKCVCFRGNLAFVPFRPENGMSVVLHGHLDVYEQGGTYQLYVDRIEPSGVGALALAIEQRKRELAAEGLFDASIKRALPVLPRRIAVVTSLSGAALRDVCTVVRRRANIVDIVVIAATVQGPDAVPTLLAAMQRAQQVDGADVILLVRGGGSLEDLMAFNDVELARAIRASRLPVVVGVGHETDTTIADLVADHRAATPSAAAELAVPVLSRLGGDVGQRINALRQSAQRLILARHLVMDRHTVRLENASPRRRVAGLRQDVDARSARLRSAALAGLGQKRRAIDNALLQLRTQSPAQRAAVERERLHNRGGRLDRALLSVTTQGRAALGSRQTQLTIASPGRRIEIRRSDIEARRQRLVALSPLRVLERGYSITTDATTGKVVTAAVARPGQRLVTRLADGEVESTVTRQGEGAQE